MTILSMEFKSHKQAHGLNPWQFIYQMPNSYWQHQKPNSYWQFQKPNSH